jgi:hypothetical protein
VFDGVHLRKVFRLGEALLMATNAKDGGVQLDWCHRSRIVGVGRERPVAGLAGYAFVHALALHIQHVGMTAFADLMPGIANWQSCDLSYGIGAVMTVAPKAARYQKTSQCQERNQPNQENCCHAKQVSRILEDLHAYVPHERSRAGTMARANCCHPTSEQFTICSILGLI